MLFLPFSSSSWWVHVVVISLICTDGRLTGKGDEMYISSKGDRYSIRGGNISPTVEKDRKEDR
jgi:hypothetical protein